MAHPPCIGATTSTRSPSASGVAWRAGAGTNRPFTAVAILRPPKPRLSSAAASVPGATSCASSLRKIRIVLLQVVGDGSQRGHLAGEPGPEQESVPVEAVGADDAAIPRGVRQVVGKGRSQVGAQFDDLGLAERRMQ